MAENLFKSKYPTKWGNNLEITFQEVGDGVSARELTRGDKTEELEKRLKEGRKIKAEQDIQLNWSRKDSSKFWERYRGIKKELGREKY